jgi:hypothetical protein
MTWPKTAMTLPSSLMGMRCTTMLWPLMKWDWLTSGLPVWATMCMRVFSTTAVQCRPIWASGARPRNWP